MQEARATAPTLPPELYHFLGRAIFRLRWATLGIVLVITLALPREGGSALSTWALLGIFAAYNLCVDLLRRRMTPQFSFLWLAIIDLPVAGLLYLVDAEPGGPLFVLVVLAVDSAAASLTLRGTLIYTAGAALLAAIADLTVGFAAPTPLDLRLLGVRLVVLALLGAAMAILTRRLALEQEGAHAAHDQAAQLAAIAHIRADFIATVSHELRTPLTAARAALVLLDASAAGRHQPDEHALLNNARRNIERLSLLIDDLLTHNQLEAGTLQLDQQVCDLRAIVTDATAAVYPLLHEKGQSVALDLPQPLPIMGDAPRLEQVIVNLLANAHHHTPPGTRISVAGQVREDEVRLVIQDTGPGIPTAELESIFQRFYRLGTTEHGSGLGLAIARRLVQLQGGRIWAESSPGAGATLAIILPSAMQGE
jgi:signal transduction histidine kinase